MPYETVVMSGNGTKIRWKIWLFSNAHIFTKGGAIDSLFKNTTLNFRNP